MTPWGFLSAWKNLNMPFIYHKNVINMPRGRVKVLKANSESIILETAIGTDYRITIPKAIRTLIKPEDSVKVTIEKA